MQTPLLDTNPPPKGRFLPALKKALRRIITRKETGRKKEEVWIINHTYFAQEWAIAAYKEKKLTMDVPKEYRRHAKVFSEMEAKHFPPSRPEDHAIKLKEGAPDTMNCKVYPLTQAEREAT